MVVVFNKGNTFAIQLILGNKKIKTSKIMVWSKNSFLKNFFTYVYVDTHHKVFS